MRLENECINFVLPHFKSILAKKSNKDGLVSITTIEVCYNNMVGV